MCVCVLGSKIVWSKSCYSSLHDSAFYCRFTNEYSLNIYCGSFQSDVDGCKFFSEINLKYTLTFDKQKNSNKTTIKNWKKNRSNKSTRAHPFLFKNWLDSISAKRIAFLFYLKHETRKTTEFLFAKAHNVFTHPFCTLYQFT